MDCKGRHGRSDIKPRHLSEVSRVGSPNGQFEAQKVTTESVSPFSTNVRYDGRLIGTVQKLVGTDQYCCAVQVDRRGKVLEVFGAAPSISKGAQAVVQQWLMQVRVARVA